MEERLPKRRKLDTPQTVKLDIRGAFELHNLLRFKQSITPEVKSGLDTFKSFLFNITSIQDAEERRILLKVLKQYCDDQSSATKEQVDFPDILSTWSFAAESNAEAVCSAAPATLAQFFKTISGELEFREFGLSLCHSLLKREQLRLLERGLSSPKSKEHLISPCLRLLTEITGFDGGVLASSVFARRDILFKRLDTLLESPAKRDPAYPRRPTARRMAQRLLIALVKYSDYDSLAEIITQGKMLHSCIKNLSTDSEDIVVDIIQTTRRRIVDGNISRSVKSRFLNSGNLSLLGKLYTFEPETDEEGKTISEVSVRETVHELLLHICTTKKGISVLQSGWYPPGMHSGNDEDDTNTIDLGLDSPYNFDDYTTSIPVKNSTLSVFCQTLRPERDTLQAELMLKIFASVPELVADYFSKKSKFSVPPSDDPIWRGHFAFLYSVIQLPIPPNYGWHGGLLTYPPPLSIVIENILPRPFDRSTISKCFSMNDDIITMSAARLLTVSLGKLRAVLDLFRPKTSLPIWHQAASRLTDMFIKRIPVIQDIITALQSTPKENMLIRGAILESMAVIYETLPTVASNTKFDISSTLAELLKQLSDDEVDSDDRKALMPHLSYVITIARLSNNMKWWHKSEGEPITPLSALLRFSVTSEDKEIQRKTEQGVRPLLLEKGVLEPSQRSYAALTASLTKTSKWTAELATYEFLDNCMTRTMKQPVKYLDQLESIQQLVSDKKPVSLVVCCIAEQWPFVLKHNDRPAIKNISEWIARFFNALEAIGENFRVMIHLQQQMVQQVEGKNKSTLEKAFEKQRKKPLSIPEEQSDSGNIETRPADPGLESNLLAKPLDLLSTFGSPATQPSSLSGLTKWDKADYESEMYFTQPTNQDNTGASTNRISRLIQCLSSPSEELRLQSHQIIQTVMHYVNQSTYSEKQQLYLVLGELCETARSFGLDKPLPSIATSLAILMLRIISDPSDAMYSKVNKFLLRSPVWDMTKLISYWVDKILLSEPETDEIDVKSVGGGDRGGHHAEVERLLDVLVDGLRSADDMEVYRKSNVFERVLTLYSSPRCESRHKKKILLLVYRAIQAGGVDTLITRVAIKAWLQMMLSQPENSAIIDSLAIAVEQGCSKEYIQRWEADRPVLRAGMSN